MAENLHVRIALIVGSVREPRMADPLLAWLRERLAAVPWLDPDVVDLADVDLAPQRMSRGVPSPIAHRLAAADGFLVLTPEYNHSFPGPLKNAIDWHRGEWAHKPVAFVAYGAGSGGLRAVEQLRQVFPELRATTVREAVFIGSPWSRLDELGAFRPGDATEAALTATLAELRWWAETLRAGRDRDRVLATA